MQLAPSLPSASISPAGSSLLAAPVTGEALPAVPLTQGSLVFAERFPDLASAGPIAAVVALTVPPMALRTDPLGSAVSLAWLGNFRPGAPVAGRDLTAEASRAVDIGSTSPADGQSAASPETSLPTGEPGGSPASSLLWASAVGCPVLLAGWSFPVTATADVPSPSSDSAAISAGDESLAPPAEPRAEIPDRRVSGKNFRVTELGSRAGDLTASPELNPVAGPDTPEVPTAPNPDAGVAPARSPVPAEGRGAVAAFKSGESFPPSPRRISFDGGSENPGFAHTAEPLGRLVRTVDGVAEVETDAVATSEQSRFSLDDEASPPVAVLTRVVAGRLVEVAAEALENPSRSPEKPVQSTTRFPEVAQDQAIGRPSTQRGPADAGPASLVAAALKPGPDEQKNLTGLAVAPQEKRAGPVAQVVAESRPPEAVEPEVAAYRNNGDEASGRESGRAARREAAASMDAGPASAAAGRAANLAAVYGENPTRVTPAVRDTAKLFLSPSPEEVASGEPALGTEDAKTAPSMFATAFARQSSPDLGGHASPVLALIGTGEQPRTAGSSSPGTAAAAAQHSVTAVLEAVERFAAGGTQGVHLQFSVAGSDLSIRVELRGGEVQATFRTDSGELRAALAQEWETVSSSEAGRPLRAIDPVFAPAKSAGIGSSSGESSPQSHRDPDARQAGETAQPQPAILSRPDFVPVTGTTATASRSEPDLSSVRLHAFA